jgi:hypothetical protein
MVRARKPILTSFLFSRKRQKLYRYPISPFTDISCSTGGSGSEGRGRDEDCSSPPAQIPASAANAPGSSLGFWRRNGGRATGVMSLLAERSDRRG